MILTNYWNFAAYMGTHNMTFDSNTSVDVGVKDLTGTAIAAVWVDVNFSAQYKQFAVATAKNYSLRSELSALVGSGTTAAQIDDYALADDITESISNLAVSSNTGADEEGLKTTITVTGTNLTGADITISEIGIAKPIYYFDQQWSEVKSKLSLFAREVLKNPVSVPDGQGFSITFEWLEA